MKTFADFQSLFLRYPDAEKQGNVTEDVLSGTSP